MNTGFELEKHCVEHRLMCDVSLMWYRKTTQLAKHSDMAPVLTDWQLPDGKRTQNLQNHNNISNSCWQIRQDKATETESNDIYNWEIASYVFIRR